MAPPPWLVSAFGALGTHEAPGDADNPQIRAMHAALGAPKPDALAWCSSFAAWALLQAGGAVPTGVTRAARSWLRADGLRHLQKPQLGALAVLRRPGAEPWQGHVGFLVGWTSALLLVLGGNQRDAVSVAPYDVRDLLGLRWPG